MKSLAFGEILWDVVEGIPHIGGAPFNVSAHLAKLGVQSSIVSCVGADELGTKAYDICSELAVSTEYLNITKEFPTGTVDIFLSDGQPDYSIHENVAWDNTFLSSEQIDALETNVYDIFIFGALAQRSLKNQETLDKIFHHGNFDHVFFDVNIRKNYYSREILFNSFERCSILKLNEDEVSLISRELFGKELESNDFCFSVSDKFSINTIIITLGEKGAFVFDQQSSKSIPGNPVTVKDTIGAGDSFSAAFLYTYLRFKDSEKAAINGCKLGGFVASSSGAIPDYDPNEILIL